MDWKVELSKYEAQFGYHLEIDWSSPISIIKNTLSENNSAEAYVRSIYFLHNVLVEERYTESEGIYIQELLKKTFNESREKFSNDSEYLFFIGKILHISEWYFGLEEDDKPKPEQLAIKMQKKASEIEPTNILYEWAYLFSVAREVTSSQLAEQILSRNGNMVDWLTSKGFPGNYVLDSIKWAASRVQ